MAKKKTATRAKRTGSVAKKSKLRAGSESSARTSSVASSQSDRFAGEPRVYRFWQDASGFLAFAGGLWKGDGVHGDPERDGEYKWTSARFGANGIELGLLTARPMERPRGLRGLFAGRTSRPSPGARKETQHFPAANLKGDVDVISAIHGGRRVDLQAIDANRLYLMLRDTGTEGRIEFAGVLTRE